MYTLADAAFHKADWGHSSNLIGVEIASRAKVKHPCLFHNEPTACDSDLDEFLFNIRMYGIFTTANIRACTAAPISPENHLGLRWSRN